jgi:hypothetical protein
MDNVKISKISKIMKSSVFNERLAHGFPILIYVKFLPKAKPTIASLQSQRCQKLQLNCRTARQKRRKNIHRMPQRCRIHVPVSKGNRGNKKIQLNK